MTPSPVSRRKLLAVLTTAGTTTIAGCNGGETDTTPTPTEQGTSPPTETATNAPTETTSESEWDFEIQNFVERNGAELRVDGGPYQFTGMMATLTHTADEFGHRWSDLTMDVAVENDITAYRCWGFPAPWDDIPATHQAPGEFNDEWLEYFDYTVAKAKEAGVRLIVPLLQGVHVDASNDRLNYAPSPAAYGTWSDTADYTDKPGAFIEDDQANEYFKEHIEYFLTRENQYTGVEYRNEPAILMWECANELEYKSQEKEGESIAFWYEDIASYIKSIDSNHLVSTGMHGSIGEIYEPWTRRCAYVEDHQVDEIDVCSFHDYPIYPSGEGVRIRSPELATRYAEHKIDLAHNEIGKPVYAGEYGIHFVPDADTAFVSRIETAESASGVERNETYPQAYRDQYDDGVLVTRQQDIEGVDLSDRNEYFRNLTAVAAENEMNGVGFWTLGPDTAGESASREERREHRRNHNPLVIYPSDTETLSVVQEYYTSVVE